MIEITLTNIELIQAAMIGCMRTIRGKKLNDPSRRRKKEKEVSQWHIDIEAACAEMAFAKGRDLYWSGVEMNTFKAGDVGDVQVRHTHLVAGCLVLRPDDGDSEPFALVVGAAPKFITIGWIYGSDGKRPEWLHGQDTTEPYWRVPQSVLNQFEERETR